MQSLKTIWNRFGHSSSHIQRKTSEKVVKSSRSRTLISTTFPSVISRMRDLGFRYRLHIVFRHGVHPLVQVTTIWGAYGTRKLKRHWDQSRYPPLRYVLKYIASYIEEYWADQYSVKNKSEIKMFVFTVFQGSGAGIRKRDGNLWGARLGCLLKCHRVGLPIGFHHVSGSLRRNRETP